MTLSGVRDKKHPYQFKFHHADTEETVNATVPFHPELLPATGSPRERLALWATHPENRSFARTAVNRFWALITGKPLVDPIDDVPLEGPFPPGLEILTDDFIAHQFDIRRLLHVIAATHVFHRDSRSSDDAVPPTAAHEDSWAAFPMTRLRPEQVAGAIIQGSSLNTLDAQSHILVRLMQFGQTNDFIQRYGDAGEDEFKDDGGTIPQRLVLMNGKLVHERTHDNPFLNAAARIAMLAPDNDRAIEIAYLTLLTRRPLPNELAHFNDRFKDHPQNQRQRVVEDLCWALINVTEFAWNH